ncbi:unnamed protein product [Caenorhabditis sp. 36 PRJEB53466]|nr:unnamed protein product [Caenorhabditis sp. 36 PRJEB53466]
MSDEASKYFFEERSDSTNHTPINESASRFSQTVFLELYKKAGINGEPFSGSSVPSVRDSALPIRYPTPQPLPDLSALARFVSGAPQSPVPRPRTITPAASFASLSSTSSDTPQPNSIRRVGNIADASKFKAKRVFLLAARRLRNADGSFALILVEPKSGKRFIENEKVYNEVHRLSLGDFFTAQTDGKSLSVHRKIKNHGGGLKTSVQGDLVHVENVQATLVNRNGVLAFRSKYFDDAHCNEKMPEGEYIIKLFALEPPQTTPSKKFFFHAFSFCQVSAAGKLIQGAGFAKKEDEPLVPMLQNLTVGTGFASQKYEAIIRFWFAARREKNADGTTYLVLVAPKTGERANVNEELPRSANVVLGDFLTAKHCPGSPLKDFKKTQHNAQLKVQVNGDVAYVEDVKVTVVNVNGKSFFRGQYFAQASSRTYVNEGEYLVRINLLQKPAVVSPTVKVHFAGTLPKPVGAVCGAGFAPSPPPPPPQLQVGAGFTAANLTKLKAVVLDVKRETGTHFLWVFDKKTEGYFVSNTRPLQKGHFFEALFTQQPNGKWTSQQYEKAIEYPIKGGLDAYEKVWFQTILEHYQPASFNLRYAQATSDHFGIIVDVDSKLPSDFSKKQVNIQRRRLGSEYVWVVSEVL